jgi:PIN domain nuclease of toxin-antitoxin system
VIVLDTHVWLWWVTAPERLSPASGEAVERSSRVGVSTLSAWEIAMLTARGRISLDREVSLWVRQALADRRVQTLAPGPEVAATAGLLDAERFPGDPVDRLIHATARSVGATLLTRDRAIRMFDPRGTLW